MRYSIKLHTIRQALHRFTAVKCYRINTLPRHRATAPQHYRATAPPRRHHTAHTAFYYCPHYNTKHVKN